LNATGRVSSTPVAETAGPSRLFFVAQSTPRWCHGGVTGQRAERAEIGTHQIMGIARP
jgi:hypothetical protein